MRKLRVAWALALSASVGMNWMPAPVRAWAADVSNVQSVVFGSTAEETAKGLDVDAVGNTYISGHFLGTVDFDPGPGTATLTSVGDGDVYVVKFDSSGAYVWAKQFGVDATIYSSALAVDSTGNIYVTGAFSGTTDFDPGSDVASLTSLGAYDTFVVKLDSSGGFVWVKQLGGPSDIEAYDVAVDSSDNVVVAGNFSGSADFDPGTGTESLTAGQADGFVVKLASSGSFLWARQFGSADNNDIVRAVDVDSSGNVVLTGDFKGTADFDPGAGSSELTAVNRNGFVVKMDSSGAYVWARQLAGSASGGYEIAVDSSANVFVAGEFQFTVDFDPGLGDASLTTSGPSNAFVLKLNSSGSYVWVKQFGGSTTNAGGLGLDKSGNVFLGGDLQGEGDFDPGDGTVTLKTFGKRDAFIVKLDALGRYVWVKQFGGTTSDSLTDLVVDASGHAYLVGEFEGTADFDPGDGALPQTSAGGVDIFLVKLAAEASPQSAADTAGAAPTTSPDGGQSTAASAASDGSPLSKGRSYSLAKIQRLAKISKPKGGKVAMLAKSPVCRVASGRLVVAKAGTCKVKFVITNAKKKVTRKSVKLRAT
ncbi:MAG: SBBP repeat-containing protein [Ilumatobacteraceae bacterium]|jgi:hypothetical protein